ncbi:glycosyl transferase, group 1 [Pyrobaculum arsenaticum DSM 13514]|uniref:Glycosyl transferase, group 1 n=1 Tax=Pyrobaculum arsenaticum (strain DSM 13514 / JCM 11321 / PZ6) TaxID=340102 RepID=A4WHU6_PYRAR|nr:glycosyl transferase, group 1 [Pyrobaculum arsenaticum DSM 13514]
MYNLAKHLRMLGVDAYAIDCIKTAGHENQEDFILRVKCDSNLHKVLCREASARCNVLKEVVFARRATKILDKFDVVHVNTAWVGFTLSLLLRRPRFVYTCHNPLWPEDQVHFGEKIVRIVEGHAMRRAHAVIALNNTMKRSIEAKAKVGPSKIFIVPNGVDTEFYRPNLPCEHVNEEYGLEGKKVVLFVGRVTWGKGVHILLKAIKRLRDFYNVRDVKALIVGPLSGFYKSDKPSSYAQLLMSYAKANNLGVVFTGSIDSDMLRYVYSCSHVLVLPSYFEAFGMVLIEAMASGIPVIGSRAGGIPDIIEEGVNGFTFPVGDDVTLAEKLYTLLTDESLHKNMANAARSIAVTRYSWKIVAKKLLKLYEIENSIQS